MKSLPEEVLRAAEAYFWTPRKSLDVGDWFSAIQTLERMMKEASLDEWAELMLVARQNIAIAEEATPALRSLRWKMPLESSPEYISRMLDHSMVSLSVNFARDRLSMRQLGIITAPDGDLRKARLLPPTERALELVRWKRFRENPEHIAEAMAEAVRKSDFGFFRRLATALKTEAVTLPFEVGNESKAERTPRAKELFPELLLKLWASPRSDSKGNPSPPLCYFTPDGLCDYLRCLHEKANSEGIAFPESPSLEDVRGLGIMWERLGLRRSCFANLANVEAERTRRDPTKIGSRLKISN